MSKNVFILGAGTSKHTGAPLMNNFLDVAEDLLKENKIEDKFKEDFKCIFQAIAALKPIFYGAKIDLDNIENLFAAFEMGKLINEIPGLPSEKIETLTNSIKRFIYITLEKSVLFKVQDERIYPSDNYTSFVNLIDEINEQGLGENKCSIITFNYDIALDFALHCYGKSINYGLPKEKNSNSIYLLKLHGSLNWAKCPECGQIIPWHLYQFFSKYQYLFLKNGIPAIIDIASKLPLSGLKCCNKEIKAEPFLVPPVWSKTTYYQGISYIWGKAAKELSDAENIFISGYSLTESDMFFRYLFALSATKANRIKRFWVFDPDESGIVCKRFEDFLGYGLKNRFRFVNKEFGQSINIIKKELL